MSNDILYPATVGMEVMINTKPILKSDGSIMGFKEGVGDYGFIIESYTENGIDYFVIDMGNGRELHFTREHFEIVEEP